ncbi:MAG: cation transporter [Deltaproteobacteria bacterium]|nr:cation transporter [Deltaproteobacteria bacterium]
MERRRLSYCIWLTGGMMVAEAIGGWLVNSLALLSDAGHMLTHCFALLVSFLAIVFAGRPATSRVSYGFYRLEILAALFNGLTLLAIAVGIAIAAYARIVHPEPVNAVPMFWVALLGLAVNIATSVLLRDAGRDDLNVKGAYLHMLGDAWSSVGVLAGALLMWRWGWYLVDPLLAVGICCLILVWSWRLIRDAVLVLMEATPPHIDVEHVRAMLVREVPGIADVHDIHAWAITSGLYAMTAHVRVADLPISETMRIRAAAAKLLDDRFDITHAILQFEC